jgi:hypothetical protein
MKNNKLLLFALIGLLAVTFAIPSVVAAKPSWALDSDDVDGWWVFAEGEIPGWNYTYVGVGTVDLSFTAWYQIWINNNTAWPTAGEAWLNATAGMVIIVMEFNDDLDDFTIDLGLITVDVNLWGLISPSLVGAGAVQKNVPGLSDAYTWSEGGAWAGIGYKGPMLLVAAGYDSQGEPMNPFDSGILAKTPAETGAGETDIINLMGTQGSAFPSGIPGFSFVPILISLVVIASIIFLIRKDQLSLLKTI